MPTLDERFQRLVQAAQDDPEVIGLALTGSRGKGFGTEASDYDALVLLRDEAPAERRAWYEAQAGEGIELWPVPHGDFAGHVALCGSDGALDSNWNERYSYANASVLVDKTGQLQQLVDWKGFVPDELRFPLARQALDGYINSLYRSLKCLRNGNRLGARLEAADSIGAALTFIFALEGRHRPYYGYLERELRARPLKAFPLDGDELLAMIDAIAESGDAAPQQRLLAVIETVARQVECGSVIASWGEDYGWMRSFRPDAPSG